MDSESWETEHTQRSRVHFVHFYDSDTKIQFPEYLFYEILMRWWNSISKEILNKFVSVYKEVSARVRRKRIFIFLLQLGVEALKLKVPEREQANSHQHKTEQKVSGPALISFNSHTKCCDKIMKTSENPRRGHLVICRDYSRQVSCLFYSTNSRIKRRTNLEFQRVNELYSTQLFCVTFSRKKWGRKCA